MADKYVSVRKYLVFLIVVATLINFGRFSVEFIMPLYIKSISDSIATTGIVLAVSGLTMLLLEVPCGWLSDIIGRQKLMVGRALIGTLAIFLYRFADIRLIVIARILYGLSVSMFYPSMRAWILDISTKSSSTTAFGILYALISIGSFFGNIVGGYLIQTLGFIQSSTISSIVVLSSVIPTIVVRMPDERDDFSTSKNLKQKVLNERKENENGSYKLLFPVYFINFLWFFVMISTGMAFPIYAEEFLLMSIAEIGFIRGLSSMMTTPFEIISGSVADKIGRRRLVLFGLLLLMASCFFLVFVKWIGLVILVLSLGSVGRGLIWPLMTSYVAEKAPRRSRGMSMAFFGLSEDMAAFLAPATVGVLWSYFTAPAFPFNFAGFTAFLTLLLAYFFIR